jgi:hypothetical protein
VAGNRGVGARLRKLHAADRTVLSAWWRARLAVVEAAERRNRVRESSRRKRQRVMGGMSDRQRTSAERAINDESIRLVSDSARRRQRRAAWVRSRLIEADGRKGELPNGRDASLSDTDARLFEATSALIAQMPWAADVTGLSELELSQLQRLRGSR